MTRTQQAIALAAAVVSFTAMVVAGPDEDKVAGAPTQSADERTLAPRVNHHRPLRSNPVVEAAPRDPSQPFTAEAAYGDIPEYTVVAREDALSFYPCEDCHGMLPTNPARRELYSPHPGVLDHGAGRIWCLDCHGDENRNALQTFAGEEFGFNESYMICGQCHYQPQKDWFFGAHGKRVGTWQGERELYNCTHCHDPHSPAVRPRQPEAPPPVRRGLQAQELERVHHSSVIDGSKSHE
jgi:uncharacterized CHY-type Zn-finger protein